MYSSTFLPKNNCDFEKYFAFVDTLPILQADIETYKNKSTLLPVKTYIRNIRRNYRFLIYE